MPGSAHSLGSAVDRTRFQREATEAEILRRTDELRKALINAVSHDLRTPLASIIASAGTLRQRDVAWSDDERDEAILRVVRANLLRHGFQAETAESGQQALAAYGRRAPDLILLDLGLPDTDGLDVIRAVRAKASTPIVVLSVRGGEREKVAALDLGADDYLTKPFGVEELLARVRVALRHAARPARGAEAVFRTGDLAVDLEHRRVTVGGREVHLTPTEYELLKVFIAHPNKVLTDRMLLQSVWGPGYGDEENYLHVYVKRLRRKIEADPQAPRYVVTEPGSATA